VRYARGERGISEKKPSLATLAAGLFYISADSVRQFNSNIEHERFERERYRPRVHSLHCPVYTGF
jgi:hypothetical protein